MYHPWVVVGLSLCMNASGVSGRPRLFSVYQSAGRVANPGGPHRAESGFWTVRVQPPVSARKRTAHPTTSAYLRQYTKSHLCFNQRWGSDLARTPP